jgi:hypothetical protein
VIEFTPFAVRPDIPTYGAIMCEFTFVITAIGNNRSRPLFHASVKKLGAVRFDGTRTDLGHYRRFNDAAKACEDYYRKNVQ